MPFISRPNMTFCKAVSQGSSSACWKTMPRSWPQPATSRPSTVTRPPLAVSSPMAMRSAVVLPQPDGPISETISPSRTVKLTFDSAWTVWISPATRSVKRFDTSMRLTSPIENSPWGGLAAKPRNPPADSCPSTQTVGYGAARLTHSTTTLATPSVCLVPRQQRHRLFADGRIDHRREIDRLRHAADADGRLLNDCELVHRNRQVGSDRVRLHGPVVDEGGSRIVGLGAGDLVAEIDRLVAMAHGEAQALHLGGQELGCIIGPLLERLAGRMQADAQEIRHRLAARHQLFHPGLARDRRILVADDGAVDHACRQRLVAVGIGPHGGELHLADRNAGLLQHRARH